jgi:hypothetical protein
MKRSDQIAFRILLALMLAIALVVGVRALIDWNHQRSIDGATNRMLEGMLN